MMKPLTLDEVGELTKREEVHAHWIIDGDCMYDRLIETCLAALRRLSSIEDAMRVAADVDERRGFERAKELAAKLVEGHDEVTHLKTGKLRVEPKTSTNINGNGYAEAIRAIKFDEVR